MNSPRIITEKEMNDLLIWVENNKTLNWGGWKDYPLSGCSYLSYDNDPVVVKFDSEVEYIGFRFKYLSIRGTYGLPFWQFSPVGNYEGARSYFFKAEKKERMEFLKKSIADDKERLNNGCRNYTPFPNFSQLFLKSEKDQTSYIDALPQRTYYGGDYKLDITDPVQWVYDGLQGKNGRNKKRRFVPVLTDGLKKKITARLEEIRLQICDNYKKMIDRQESELSKISENF